MKSRTPKVLFDVCGLPALAHVVRAAAGVQASRIHCVVSPENQEPCEAALVARGTAAVSFVVQDPPLGTGHAVREALPAIPDESGQLLILYGDGPLLRQETLASLIQHHETTRPGATLLTTQADDPTGYGRIVLADDGTVERIVEELDADDQIRQIREINTGVLVLDLERGRGAIQAISNQNAKGEYYLTDVVEILRQQGLAVERLVLEDSSEVAAFNSHEELATVRALMRRRIIQGHQRAGVDVVDPLTTYIDADVEIGAGSTIYPCSVIGAGVVIGAGCSVGPFAHLRGGTELGHRSQIGNFTEVKNSRLGEGTLAKHLSYLGDADVGSEANIGCGTITANFDGKTKHRTSIGDGASIGSGTVLIAPTRVGERAATGAGAIVTRNSNIEPDEIYVGVPARRFEKRDPSDPADDATTSGGTGP